MAKRAVLYARVSSDDTGKDGRNLRGQLEMCQQYANEQGWDVVERLAEDDRGASGAAMDLPQLNRVLQMADNGELDVLVVRELDRLSRELAKQLYIENKLKSNGVEIRYVLGEYDDTPEGIFMKNVRAVVAEYERLKITERSVRGRRQKVKAGNVMLHGQAPYGYRKSKQDGQTSLEVFEEEAKVVRLIYQWYTVGDGESGPLSMYAITHALTEKQIPTRGDTSERVSKDKGWGEWHISTVSRILANETYRGVWHYGKRNADGKNSDSYLIPVEVPAIIDQETWEAAQRRKAKNILTSKRNMKWDYLLAHRAYCGKCGTRLAAVGRRNKTQGPTLYYHCPVPTSSQVYAKVCDQNTYFRADEIEPPVWAWVKDLLMREEAIDGILRERHQESEQAAQPLRDRLAMIEDALTQKEQQLERLLDLYLNERFPKDVLSKRHGKLETELGDLERERRRLENQIKGQTMNEGQVETVREVALELAQGLEKADEHFEARRRIIDLLDVQVTTYIEQRRKALEVECHIGEKSVAIASRSS